MTLHFTPDFVTAVVSGDEPRMSHNGLSTARPYDEGAKVLCLEDAMNAQAEAWVNDQVCVIAETLRNRDGIETLHREIDALPQIEIETRHYFADGLYAREIFVPAGMWVVGAIHAESHINVLSQGTVSVATEGGGRKIQAPATFEAVAGRKVVGFTHTDCTWTTFHANPTDERNPEALFSLLTLNEYPNVIIENPTAVKLLEGSMQ